MNKKRIALFALCGLMVSALAFGGCRGKHCKMSPEDKADFISKRIAKELDLTAEQKTKLEFMKVEILAKVKEHKQDHAGMHKKIVDLIISDELDRNVLNKLADQRHAKMQQLKPFIIDKIIEFHKMLTPDQRQKLAEKLDKFHGECNK